jgi:ATP-binding cassette subfamily B protein
VTGRIGSGKTTLLRVLLGLLEAGAGELRWNGRLVEKPDEFMVPPRCAYTPQVPRLFSDTLRDNILLGLPEDRVDLPAGIAAAVLERDLADLRALRARRRAVIALSRRRLPRRRPRTPELPSRSVRW